MVLLSLTGGQIELGVRNHLELTLNMDSMSALSEQESFLFTGISQPTVQGSYLLNTPHGQEFPFLNFKTPLHQT